MDDISKLAKDAADDIRKFADRVEQLSSIATTRQWSFVVRDLTRDVADEFGKKLRKELPKGAQCIYTISLVGGPEAGAVIADLNGHIERGARHLPSRNVMPMDVQSRTLYVGSSEDMGKRFREHIGWANDGTSALRLSEWATHWSGDILIEAIIFEDQIDAKVLCAMEDYLASIRYPMTGQRGASPRAR